MTDLATVALAAGLAKSGEAVKSGPIGLGVILLLCIACYFLFKSMSKHLRTVREEFPPDDPNTATRAADREATAAPQPVDLHKAAGKPRTGRPGTPPAPPVHP